MESRKLIQSGPSSLSITLPNKWLKDNNLSKSDDLFLDIQKDSIKLLPQQNINKIKIEKEYNISTDKLYLIKEHLNYCFLNNYNKIRLRSRNYDLNNAVDIIKSFPGFTYKISKEGIIINNYFNKEKINPFHEFNSILITNKFLFNQIFSQEKDVKELILRINNLNLRALTCESMTNNLLDTPFKVSKFGKSIKELINLKLSLKGLYLLFENEINILERIDSIEEINKYMDTIEQIKSKMKPPNKPIKYEVALKSIKDNISNLLEIIENVNDFVFLFYLRGIVDSLLIINQTS